MRPIDADALIADLDKGLWGKDYDKALAEAIINDAPSIDIVTCSECKHSYMSGYRCEEYSVCGFFGKKINADDFCSRGERSE